MNLPENLILHTANITRPQFVAAVNEAVEISSTVFVLVKDRETGDVVEFLSADPQIFVTASNKISCHTRDQFGAYFKSKRYTFTIFYKG